METKRLIIAIALSIVVITVYQYFFMPKPEPVVSEPATGQESVSPRSEETGTPERQQPREQKSESLNLDDLFAKEETPEKPAPEPEVVINENIGASSQRDIIVDTPLYRAVFTNKGAALQSFVLKKRIYGDRPYLDDEGEPLDLITPKAERLGLYPFHFSPFAGDPLSRELNKVLFSGPAESQIAVMDDGRHEILFRFADVERELSVYKRFVFMPHTYLIDVSVEVVSNGEKLDLPVIFGPDLVRNGNQERVLQQPLKIGAYDGDDIDSFVFAKMKTTRRAESNIEEAKGPISGSYYWAAFETTYFAAMFKTDARNPQLAYHLLKEKGEGNQEILYPFLIIADPGMLYLGPKDEQVLSTVDEIFVHPNKVVEYGWFGSIAKIMLRGINFIHRNILNYGNYGWAIILFTIFLKLLLFPLTYSSSVSMGKMQALQPKMKAIRKKYRNQKDPAQRKAMNVELMDLYKKEKVNPAGGCLPLLLQLPILWGFFRLLAVSINVRHEPWLLWIKDLSMKDPYYILPILMVLTQILLQKMSPTSGAEGAQKKMMYIMPLLIGFFVMNLPSGLNLYWFVSNLLQIGQQQLINKRVFAQKKEEARQRKLEKRKKRGK